MVVLGIALIAVAGILLRIHFPYIYLTNPAIELWRAHIKLGSTRQEVQRAFGRLRPIEVSTDCYYDSFWNVGFDFDEQDALNRIIIFSPLLFWNSAGR